MMCTQRHMRYLAIYNIYSVMYIACSYSYDMNSCGGYAIVNVVFIVIDTM